MATATSQNSGFTPGFASVLECEDGSRHFVKAASVRAQRMFAERAAPLRAQLVQHCERLLAEAAAVPDRGAVSPSWSRGRRTSRSSRAG